MPSLFWIYWAFTALIFFTLVVLAIRKGAREAASLSLTRSELVLPLWPDSLRNLRILHISDLHFFAGSDLGSRVLALAKEAKPDLVFITGDLIYPVIYPGSKSTGNDEAEAFLRECAAHWPTYLCLGNEDNPRRGYKPAEAWKSLGAELLRNRAIRASYGAGHFWIVGVDDPHKGKDDLEQALKEVPKGEPVLLLAHSPIIIKREGVERISAIFSGHTHGGQICLPDGSAIYTHTQLARRFARGLHRVGNGKTILIVSRGIGSTRLPMRLWCPPEVTLWTLVPELSAQ